MIVFPNCKINLGLNVVSKREDGYHNLETVFYPVPLHDALEAKLMDKHFPLAANCDLKVTGTPTALAGMGECPDEKNLVVKAYNLIAQDFEIPRIHIHLFKNIPSQAGLGGGSSDAAYMIRLLDERFRLNMGNARMEQYAAQLGADCAFFITAEPSYATGIGDILQPIGNDTVCKDYLDGYYLALVKPNVAVSTKEAYAAITPRKPAKCCRDIVLQPVETWKNELTNDFEEGVFAIHPILAEVKQKLYDMGAVYAQMSGSGSTIFGLFHNEPKDLESIFPGCFATVVQL